MPGTVEQATVKYLEFKERAAMLRAAAPLAAAEERICFLEEGVECERCAADVARVNAERHSDVIVGQKKERNLRRSVQYRLRAAQLAHQAYNEPDARQAHLTLQTATWWIQLANNEDWLVDHSLSAGTSSTSSKSAP